MKYRPTIEERRAADLIEYDDLPLFGVRFSRQWLRKLIKAKRFPKPVKLGGARIAWVRSEIVEHVETLKQQRS